MDIEHISDWLVVHLAAPDDHPELSDEIWSVLQRESNYRLVLELHGLTVLRSRMVGELARLHKNIAEKSGAIRLCGLSEANQMILKITRLDSRLPHYDSVTNAIQGGPLSSPPGGANFSTI